MFPRLMFLTCSLNIHQRDTIDPHVMALSNYTFFVVHCIVRLPDKYCCVLDTRCDITSPFPTRPDQSLRASIKIQSIGFCTVIPRFFLFFCGPEMPRERCKPQGRICPAPQEFSCMYMWVPACLKSVKSIYTFHI